MTTEEYMEAYRKMAEEWEKDRANTTTGGLIPSYPYYQPPQPCPHCGRCPVCGRGNEITYTITYGTNS